MPDRRDLAARRRESLRRRFRPEPVRVLFIGESPPASGRFFYSGDSGLYRAMGDAFRSANPAIPETNFLTTFQAAGCYLTDLCPEPVDALDPKSRRAACRGSEASLARTIARHRPPMIITVVRSIEGNVARAIARAGWNGQLLHLPYPGRWARFRDQFVSALAEHIRPVLLSIDECAVSPGASRSTPMASVREPF